MLLSLIVAIDQKGVIGMDDAIPWRISSDMKHFKLITMGKPIVMGRKTHESIGRALPGRENIVITRDENYSTEGCTVLHSLNEALDHCSPAAEVIIIGGRNIYRQTLDKADRIYLTQVHADVMGDVFFPVFDMTEWTEVEREDFQPDSKNGHPFSFLKLERRKL